MFSWIYIPCQLLLTKEARILKNAQEWLRMLKNTQEWLRILNNAQEWIRMLKITQEWSTYCAPGSERDKERVLKTNLRSTDRQTYK